MDKKLGFVLWFMALLLCVGCSTSATSQQDSPGETSGGVAPGSGGPVAEVFGKPINAGDSVEDPNVVLCGYLMEAYLAEHHLAATLQDLDAGVAAATARLEAEGRTEDSELLKKQMGGASDQDRASALTELNRWRFMKALYEEYGGTVYFSPLSSSGTRFFPVDAYTRLLKKQEASGALRFLDPGFKEYLYRFHETVDPRFSKGLDEVAKLYFAKHQPFWTKADEEQIERLLFEWMQKMLASDQPPLDTADGSSDAVVPSNDSEAGLVVDGKEMIQEQTDFPARSFNSQMELSIVVQKTPMSRPVKIGLTPSATPVQIPTCWCWWVRPREPVADWESLAREIDRNRIPGVGLRAGTDSDLAILSRVTELRVLQLSSNRITDAGLAHLEGLTNLKYLSVHNAKITNAGLAHLRGMRGLQYFSSDVWGITNAGLAHFRGMAHLRYLFLGNGRITDAGLAHLRGMTRMQYLVVGNAGGVTDAGLAYLKDMVDMRYLWLFYALVTDEGMVYLKGMTRLEEVHWSSPMITDAGLAHLAGLTLLKELDLSQGKITDAGLAHLKSMARLRTLDLGWTNVRGTGLSQLTGLPELRDL